MKKLDIRPQGLYQLNRNDVQKASETLAEAFYDYTMFLQIGAQNRMEALTRMFEVDIRYALKRGAAYSLDTELHEIATWHFDHGQKRDILGFLTCISPRIFKLFSLAGREWLKRFQQSGQEIEKRIATLGLPQNTVYLSSLGVAPAFKGQKHARRLLTPVLRELDRKGMPVFLYTSDKKNVLIYQRFGFYVMDEMEDTSLNCKSWFLFRPTAVI